MRPNKGQGRGRLAWGDYRAARKCFISHETQAKGGLCPACGRGRYFNLGPSRQIHLVGQAPILATRYEMERLRCSGCGMVLTAREPKDLAMGKYHPSAKSMVALLRYGAGLPLNRMEKVQDSLGIPLPDATQFEMIKDVYQAGLRTKEKRL